MSEMMRSAFESRLNELKAKYASEGYAEHDMLCVSAFGEMWAEERRFPGATPSVGHGIGEEPLYHYLHPSSLRDGETFAFRGRRWTVDVSRAADVPGRSMMKEAILFAHALEKRTKDPIPLTLDLEPGTHELVMTPDETGFLLDALREACGPCYPFQSATRHAFIESAFREGLYRHGGDMELWVIPSEEPAPPDDPPTRGMRSIDSLGGKAIPVGTVTLEYAWTSSEPGAARYPSTGERIRARMEELCLWRGVPHAQASDPRVAIRTVFKAGMGHMLRVSKRHPIYASLYAD